MTLSSSPNSSPLFPPDSKHSDSKRSKEPVSELPQSGGLDTSSAQAGPRSQHQSKSDPSASLPSDWQYEAAVDKVEAIIQDIEGGELELADIFDQFSIAVQELHTCESFLQHHRHQVELLVETLANEPQT